MKAFSSGAHQAAKARTTARQLRQLTYHGRPCAHGHSGQRYTSNKHCFTCHALRTEWYHDNDEAVEHNTLLAAFYPEEFEARGWHRLAVNGGSK